MDRRTALKILGLSLLGVAAGGVKVHQLSETAPQNYNFQSIERKGPSIFDRVAADNGFIFAHVFGGNSPAHLLRAKEMKSTIDSMAADRPLTYALETDVCWTDDHGKIILYGFHPTVFQYYSPLSAKDVIRKEREGELLVVDNLLAEAGEMALCFDIKSGSGDRTKALEKLLAMSNGRSAWFESYNTQVLQEIDQISPEAALGMKILHYQGENHALLLPSNKYWPLVDLSKIPTDAVVSFFAAGVSDDVTELERDVRKMGKHLIFGDNFSDRSTLSLAYAHGRGAVVREDQFIDMLNVLGKS